MYFYLSYGGLGFTLSEFEDLPLRRIKHFWDLMEQQKALENKEINSVKSH